jgi:hypothetical protein
MPVDDENPQPLLYSWRDDAACLGYPLAWWFPTHAKGPKRRHEPSPGEKVCKYCPVKTDCLLAGLREKDGIWGGELRSSR